MYIWTNRTNGCIVHWKQLKLNPSPNEEIEAPPPTHFGWVLSGGHVRTSGSMSELAPNMIGWKLIRWGLGSIFCCPYHVSVRETMYTYKPATNVSIKKWSNYCTSWHFEVADCRLYRGQISHTRTIVVFLATLLRLCQFLALRSGFLGQTVNLGVVFCFGR